jgi:hypothetical protein
VKKLAIGALVTAQLLGVAQPAAAADLFERDTPQIGAFAGARLRLSLGGRREEQRLRAGLTLAPTMHGRTAVGGMQLRIGEGLDLGVTGREPVRLSLAGTPVNRLGQSGRGPDGRRLGVSTIGWVAIGAGVVLLAVGGFYVWLVEEAGHCGPREC